MEGGAEMISGERIARRLDGLEQIGVGAAGSRADGVER